MAFRISGLSADQFRHLFGLPEAALAAQGVERYVVDAKPSFPDRVGLRDLEPGETALLLNYTHQPADTPYRASHAIFVGEGDQPRFDAMDEIPDVMRRRMLSLRAFDAGHMLIDAADEPKDRLHPGALRQARLLRRQDRTGLGAVDPAAPFDKVQSECPPAHSTSSGRRGDKQERERVHSRDRIGLFHGALNS